jgi:hydrogenase expression/formation protein HypC
MCLGIPGRVQSVDSDNPDLADVEVAGLTRKINVGILEEPVHRGEWILIQAGFAIEKIDEETAKAQLSLLNQYTGESAINEDLEFDWDTMTVDDEDPDQDQDDGSAR